MKNCTRKNAVSTAAAVAIIVLIGAAVIVGAIAVSFYALGRNPFSGTTSSTSTISQSSSKSQSSSTSALIVNLSLENSPDYLAYDSSNGDIYVTYTNSSILSVLSGASYEVIANISVTSYSPGGMIFDPSNGDVYATLQNFTDPISSGWVYVISGATNKVVAIIDVGQYPSGLTLDSQNNCVYVANYDSDNVSVINGTTNEIVSTIGVGNNSPLGIAYDSSNGYIYVANNNYPNDSGTISVIAGSNDAVVQTLPLLEEPSEIAFDPSNHYLYVTMESPSDPSAGSVYVINGATNKEVASIQNELSDPTQITFESYNGYVYVTNSETSGYVTVIDTSSVIATITVGANPAGMAFDPTSKYLYVANYGSNTISVIYAPSDSLVATIS